MDELKKEDFLKQEREQQLSEINNKLDDLKNPVEATKWVNDRKKLLSDRISVKPDRVATKLGSITMKQHLQNLYNELDSEPEKVVAREISRLEKIKEQTEKSVAEEIQ